MAQSVKFRICIRQTLDVFLYQDRLGVVTWLVEAARYKLGSSGFDSQWGRCEVSIDLVLLSVFINCHSANDRNKYQGISWGVRVRPALGAESCAVLVVTNGKVKNGSPKFHFPPLGFS